MVYHWFQIGISISLSAVVYRQRIGQSGIPPDVHRGQSWDRLA